MSPSLCVLPPFGATTSLRGSLSWRWVTLWGCHHPLVSPFGAAKSHRGPQCNLGDTLGLSPSLAVLSPFGATKSHKGPLSWHWVALGVVTILCVPSPSGATKSHKGPLSWHWVTLWCCHHPLVSLFGATKPHRGPQCNLGGTLELSPSLAVLPPCGATKFHQWSPVMLLGDTLVLSPCLCVPPTPFGATKSHRGPLSWHWVALWSCHHPLVSPFGAAKSHRGPQCNDG